MTALRYIPLDCMSYIIIYIEFKTSCCLNGSTRTIDVTLPLDIFFGAAGLEAGAFLLFSVFWGHSFTIWCSSIEQYLPTMDCKPGTAVPKIAAFCLIYGN